MATVQVMMPKMGESILEATILTWKKKVGDPIQEDETIAEIATDKVDTDVPSPTSGTIKSILFPEGAVVPINTVMAIIETEMEQPVMLAPTEIAQTTTTINNGTTNSNNEKSTTRFYSPLVKTIAQQEGIAISELEKISGSGANSRVTKHDILQYVSNRATDKNTISPVIPKVETQSSVSNLPSSISKSFSGEVEIIEMDRMRRLIADHMTYSVQTSPHVTSFVEVDMTNIVNWRAKVQPEFQKKYGEKITFTPIFIEAVVKALLDFPMVNISVEGNKIIKKKYYNIGMATALPTGNLIVPVIKNADFMNLAGLSKAVNDLSNRARNNQLKPEDIQDGTFTITNVGTFGSLIGTPIINQPQAAILAVGAIRKKPVVIETEYGDVIAIRQMMFMSLSYDHRVIDGTLGGSFLHRIGEYMEKFDAKRQV
jgi:2-oxoglutarate dehydrogenase E2 component (dihydrolipoamide succinyltransferase)